MPVDNAAELANTAAIFAVIIGLLVWIIRLQIKMSKQFQPNGGSSLQDSVNRIEHDQRYLRDRLDQHINDHGKGQK